MIDVDRLYRSIGKNIRDLRKGKRPALTQAELADFLGITRTSITNIEKGNQRIPLHLLYILCSKLSVEISEVIPSVEDVVSEEGSAVGAPLARESGPPPKTAELIKRLSQDGGT